MKTSKRYFGTMLFIVACFFFPGMIAAGDLEPPGPPGPAVFSFRASLHGKVYVVHANVFERANH